MARTINEIQTGINTALEAGTEVKLSTSKVAEWRLWTLDCSYCNTGFRGDPGPV